MKEPTTIPQERRIETQTVKRLHAILQSHSEPTIIELLKEVRRQMPHLRCQQAPHHSHQSQEGKTSHERNWKRESALGIFDSKHVANTVIQKNQWIAQNKPHSELIGFCLMSMHFKRH
eukprot:5200964-Amphidinium_carterae.1